MLTVRAGHGLTVLMATAAVLAACEDDDGGGSDERPAPDPNAVQACVTVGALFDDIEDDEVRDLREIVDRVDAARDHTTDAVSDERRSDAVRESLERLYDAVTDTDELEPAIDAVRRSCDRLDVAE